MNAETKPLVLDSNLMIFCIAVVYLKSGLAGLAIYEESYDSLDKVKSAPKMFK